MGRLHRLIPFVFLLVCQWAHAQTCDCNQYYEHRGPSSPERKCFHILGNDGGIRRLYVRTVAQADYLCTNFKQMYPPDSCSRYTWRSLSSVVVGTSQQQTITVSLIEVVIPIDDLIQVVDCPTELADTTMANRVQSLVPDAFTPGSKCAISRCPQTAIVPADVPDAYRRFLNGNQIACNVARCPTCHCVPTTQTAGQCMCGSQSSALQWWTGNACQFFKTQYCCSVAVLPSEAPFNVADQSTVCNPIVNGPSGPHRKPWGGVCSFSDDLDAGLSACNSSNGISEPRCTRCHPEEHMGAVQPWDGIYSSYGGPRCDQTACAAAGHACFDPDANDGNKCLSLCRSGGTANEDYCWRCRAREPTCSPTDEFTCRCKQSINQLYVGPTCQYWSAGDAFTLPVSGDPKYMAPPTNGLNTVNCATGSPTRSADTWYDVGYRDRSPFVCGGNGDCRHLPGRPDTNWDCVCDKDFLPEYRCTARDPCVTTCNPNLQRATCTRTYLAADCDCKPLWYTAASANDSNTAEICGTPGCIGSVVGLPAASAAPNADATSCTCPRNIPLPGGKTIHTVWFSSGDKKGDRKGCRFECPTTNGLECGDGQQPRCPTVWFEPNMRLEDVPSRLTCNCKQNLHVVGEGWLPWLILDPATGSCVKFCVNGPYRERRARDTDGNPSMEAFDRGGSEEKPQCICEPVDTALIDPKKEIPIQAVVWSGPRCDVSLCKHGATWSTQLKRCACALATPPFDNVQEGSQDIWCETDRCTVKKRVWDADLKACVCVPPLVPLADTCFLECKVGHGDQAVDGQGRPYCKCIGAWTGTFCEKTLCADGSDINAATGNCICPKPQIATGTYCRDSHCDPQHTSSSNATICVCASPIFTQPVCKEDTCSGNFIDIATVVDNKCQCRPHAFIVGDGLTCGCPSHLNLQLEECPAASEIQQKHAPQDARCIFQQKSFDGKIYRCICQKGYSAEDEGPCEPLRCAAPGRVEPVDYVNENGFWSCACNPGYSGLNCEIRDPEDGQQRCGNGTLVGDACICDFPEADVIYLSKRVSGKSGPYCPLPCQNQGVYRLQTFTCECTEDYHYGDLCQFSKQEDEDTERRQHQLDIGSWQLWPLLYLIVWLLTMTAATVIGVLASQTVVLGPRERTKMQLRSHSLAQLTRYSRWV